MEKEFIPYEQAVALKELGFDEKCLSCYLYEVETFSWELNYQISNNNIPWIISAPLYQQAFGWFREKYNLLGNVYSNASGWLWEIHDNEGGTHRFGSEWSGDCEESGMFTSFEKAELECLKKLIQITNEKI